MVFAVYRHAGIFFNFRVSALPSTTVKIRSSREKKSCLYDVSDRLQVYSCETSAAHLLCRKIISKSQLLFYADSVRECRIFRLDFRGVFGYNTAPAATSSKKRAVFSPLLSNPSSRIEIKRKSRETLKRYRANRQTNYGNLSSPRSYPRCSPNTLI